MNQKSWLVFIPASQTAIYGVFLLALFVLASGVAIVQVVANPPITARRLSSATELPSEFLAVLKTRNPDYLIAPTEWGPRFSTWEDFFATQQAKSLEVAKP